LTSEWYFPSNRGGEESGLNDPGVEFFKNTASLSRETIQNIVDARRPGIPEGEPVRAVLELQEMDVFRFPGTDRYRRVLRASRDSVLSAWSDPELRKRNGLEFLDSALKLLEGPTMPVLRISDFNTTGLGGDIGDKSGALYRLIRGQGYHSMQGPGGGTYGIGQRAPYAFSDLRAILYSTQLADGQQRFMGKAILCSFPDPDRGGDISRPIGYWGAREEDDFEVLPLCGDDIPVHFRREQTGTDLYVTGFTRRDWEEVTVLSVLNNFFASIHAGNLEVEIRGAEDKHYEIGQKNIRDLVDRLLSGELAGDTDAEDRNLERNLGRTFHYLKALENPVNGGPFTKKIGVLGKVELHVTRGEDAPNRVAFMRRPLSLVYDSVRSIVSGFAAVCICADEPGNTLLASMEDPSHTRWNPEQLAGRRPELFAQAKKARSEINRFVRDTLKEMVVNDQPEAEDFPDLHLWLPEDEDDADDEGQGSDLTDDVTTEETGQPSSVTSPVTAIKRPSTTASPQVRATANSAGNGEGEGSSGGGGDGGGGSGPGGGDGPGTGSGTNEGGDGELPGLSPANIRFRSFHERTHADQGSYQIVVSAVRECRGNLMLKAVGQDSKYDLDIARAVDLSTEASIGVQESTMKNLHLEAGMTRRFRIWVKSPVRLSIGTAGR